MKLRGGSTASVDYCVFRDQPNCLVIMDGTSRLHMINSIVSPQTKAINCLDPATYWGDYNCWAKSDSEWNYRGFDIMDTSLQPAMERHSIVADPLFSGKDCPQVEPNSPVRNKA